MKNKLNINSVYIEYFFQSVIFELVLLGKLDYSVYKSFFNFLNFNSFIIIVLITCLILLIKYIKNKIIYFINEIYNFIFNIFKFIIKKFNNRELRYFLINDLYNSFSIKILISSTAFLMIFLLGINYCLILLSVFFFSDLTEFSGVVLDNSLITFKSKLQELDLFLETSRNKENNLEVFNTCIPREVVEFKQIKFSFNNSKFHLELLILIIIFFLLNILHTFLAFFSLGYDYILKKLTLKNISILFIIISIGLQIFLKILSIYFL